MKTEPVTQYETRTHRFLIYACDIILINACIVVVAYWTMRQVDWLWYLSFINTTAIGVLRYWIFHILKINWLASPLNMVLKRLTDILLSLIFLLTVFPVIIVMKAIMMKASRSGRGKSILTTGLMQYRNEKPFKAIIFNSNTWTGSIFERMPLVINILVGNISFWNISDVRLIPNHSTPITQYTEPNTIDYD